MIILQKNFKWHLEAFASELFIYIWKHWYHVGQRNHVVKHY